jgi:hypothetical protein
MQSCLQPLKSHSVIPEGSLALIDRVVEVEEEQIPGVKVADEEFGQPIPLSRLASEYIPHQRLKVEPSFPAGN